MKNLYRFLFLLVVVISASHFTLPAQEQASQHTRYAGKDFWFTTGDYSNFNEFVLSSKYNCTVTFTYTTNNTSYTTNVPANSPVKMLLSQMIECTMFDFETVMNKSLHIVSDSDVVIQYAGWGGLTDDGSLIYPSDKQKYGDVYYTNGLPYLYQGGGTTSDGVGGFSIVATCNNVTLRITPSRNLVSHPAGIPFTITLNKGQTYAIGNLNTNIIKDISGTKIEVMSASCCNPINVFNTGFCGFSYWPYSNPNPPAACDFFFDQLLPVSSWDTSYYVIPYNNDPYTIIKIVSSANNNMLSLNGNTFATLTDGGTLDTIIRQPVHIASSFPVSISQHMVGQQVAYTQPVFFPNAPPDDSLSDPNSAMVISMRDGIREAWFQTVGQYFSYTGGGQTYNRLQTLAIVSKTDNLGTIMLNNNNIASQFLPFPGNPGYAYAYIKPDTGVMYHLLSADKIVANYYAAAFAGSMDFALGDVNPYLYYNEHPADTIDLCATGSVTIQAMPAFSYQWSTGATTPEITTADTGQYYVLTDQNDACIGDLQRFVVRHPAISVHTIDLGADTAICEGQQIALKGQGPYTVWSTGAVAESIVIHEPGVYWATVYDSCMLALASDTMVLTVDSCIWQYCNFHFPNAFSPNGDGLNDVLLPVYYGDLSKYKLSIFNRYGQSVFTSSNPGKGWDGTMNGQLANVGVYFYRCTYYCPLRGDVQLKGDVTLIR